MNECDCGPFSIEKARACIAKLQEKLMNPQLSTEEKEDIEVDINVIENGIRYSGGKRKTRRRRQN
jgi:hypothetical protein